MTEKEKASFVELSKTTKFTSIFINSLISAVLLSMFVATLVYFLAAPSLILLAGLALTGIAATTYVSCFAFLIDNVPAFDRLLKSDQLYNQCQANIRIAEANANKEIEVAKANASARAELEDKKAAQDKQAQPAVPAV